jgi:hypothetical protein
LVGSAPEAVAAAPEVPGHACYMSALSPRSDTAHDRNRDGRPVFVGQRLVATVVHAPESTSAQIGVIGRLRGTQLPLGAESGQTSQRLIRAHVTSSFQSREDPWPSHTSSIDSEILLASEERANVRSYTMPSIPLGSPQTGSDSRTATSLSQATRLSELYSDTRRQFGGSANRKLTQPRSSVARISPIAHQAHNEPHVAAAQHAPAFQTGSLSINDARQSSEISGAAFGRQISEAVQITAAFPEFAHLATPDALHDPDSTHCTPRIVSDPGAQVPDTSCTRPRVNGFTKEEEAAAYASVATQDLRDAPRPPYGPPPPPRQVLTVKKIATPSPMQPPSYPPPPRPGSERASAGLEAKLRGESCLLKESEMDAIFKPSMQTSGDGHARVWSEEEVGQSTN